VRDLRGLLPPSIAGDQSDVELVSHAGAHARELVRTGPASIAEPSSEEADIERELATRHGLLRRERAADVGGYEQ
jgi:hypothetical protein